MIPGGVIIQTTVPNITQYCINYSEGFSTSGFTFNANYQVNINSV